MKCDQNLAAVAGCALLAAFLPLDRAHADVKLPQVISDHMVLQRGSPVPIFGTAVPGESVTVTFRDRTAETRTDAQGRWLANVDPGEPGGPFDLNVKGANAILVKDVLVGEVWLASGQSNMSLPLSRTHDATNAIASAVHPLIRSFRKETGWVVCSPKAAGKYTFSAMPYYFAVELQARLPVPVGIVDTSVAGAIAQTFVSPAAFARDPELSALVKPREQKRSSNFEADFTPIIPYAIRGALWCQGEGDRDFPATYRRLLPAVIADWRSHWGRGDFPFLIVQLANVGKCKPEPAENRESVIREIQLQTVQIVTNTALVVTIDLNDAEDVHYPNKAPAGQRLALAARALAYGEDIESAGPIFQKVEFKDGKAVVWFTHAAGRLVAKGGSLAGFQLCGSDKHFVRADAAILGSQVIVSSSRIPAPVAVRYGWECNPPGNLCNSSGLPASPFRSDAFESYYTRDDKPEP